MSGGVSTRIADKDGIWRSKPSDIGTSATHDEIEKISEKLAFHKYIKDLDFETIKVLEREHKEREIFYPGMHEDISGRDNVRSTVCNDVREADKLDTTVDGYTTNERNTASSRIEECTPKSIFRKSIKKID